MKKVTVLFSLVLLLSTAGFSQIELKFNPIGALFGQIPVSAEYIINPNIGAEATFGYYYRNDNIIANSESSRIVTSLLGKYYFNPVVGGDKFYVFPYLRYANNSYVIQTDGGEVTGQYTAFGVGFGTGYKWVANSNLVFDLGFGLGRNFSGGIEYSDPTYSAGTDLFFPINIIARLSLGYRF